MTNPLHQFHKPSTLGYCVECRKAEKKAAAMSKDDHSPTTVDIDDLRKIILKDPILKHNNVTWISQMTLNNLERYVLAITDSIQGQTGHLADSATPKALSNKADNLDDPMHANQYVFPDGKVIDFGNRDPQEVLDAHAAYEHSKLSRKKSQDTASLPQLEHIRRQLLAELPEKYKVDEGFKDNKGYYHDVGYNTAIDQCVDAINRIMGDDIADTMTS